MCSRETKVFLHYAWNFHQLHFVEFVDFDKQIIERASLRDFANHFEKFIDHYNSQPISEIEFAGNKLVVIFYLQLAYEDFTPLGETIYG